MPNRHENTDANARAILLVTIASLIGGVLMLLGLAAAFFFLKSYTESTTLPTAPPLLEIDPRAEHRAFFAREKQILESYEWVDREKGIVRIPIKQAIEILSDEH